MLSAIAGWAYEEMETCPFVHNINGVWYQIIDDKAWVSSRWHFGYELIILQDWDSYKGDVVIPETITWSSTDNPDTPTVEGGGDTYPVVGIMASAFNVSENLSSVTIPHSVKRIENEAFTSCTNLTEITIPNSVDYVGERVFEYCSGLRKVIIEDGPTTLQWNYLVENWPHLSSLEEIYVGRPYQTPNNNYAFRSLPTKSITFSGYVEQIREEDAAWCQPLETIYLGQNIKWISGSSFEGCTEVKDVYVEALVPPTVDGESLGMLFPTSTCRLHVPAGKAAAYKQAPVWKDFFSIEPIGEAPVETIDVTMRGATAGKCYATFYDSQNNYQAPTGVSVWVMTGYASGGFRYQELTDGIIPQGVAVLLGPVASDNTIVTLTAVDEATPYTGTNWLLGSDVATTTSAPYSGWFYKLCFGQKGTVFEKWFGWFPGSTNAGPFDIDAHRAWIAWPASPASSARKYIPLPGDDATSIESMASQQSASPSVFFDLQGRSIAKPQAPGIYIQHGKKVVVK